LADQDLSSQLGDAVKNARSQKQALYLRGGNSKRQLFGRRCDGNVLPVDEHRGIVRYQPEEMVLTARSGTPVAELNAATKAEGQYLAWEPPTFDTQATIGGSVATGAAGPSRPWRGGVREAVLGLRMINGLGQSLRFGGEVIKNVAGYDVSRLQVGALGTLGLITEISLRVMPLPKAQLTLAQESDAATALTIMRSLVRRPLPFTGMCWSEGQLFLRLEGSQRGVSGLHAALPEFKEADESIWQKLREWNHPALGAGGDHLWALDVAPATELQAVPSDAIIDWAGARRYLRRDHDCETAQGIAAKGRGHARKLWSGNSTEPVVAPPEKAHGAILKRVKHALDPDGLFNPGRLYRDF